jgi:hypothetical protein
LRERALYDVPDNVRQALEDWEREFRGRGVGANSAKDTGKGEAGIHYPKPDFACEKAERSAIIRWPTACSGTRGQSGDGLLAVPGPDDLFPGWRQIPPSWLKTCRNYHSSTRKDMVTKALEWKTCLKLRAGDRERLICPSRLKETVGGWCVEGREGMEKVEIASREWEEMQILLPETGNSWYDN